MRKSALDIKTQEYNGADLDVSPGMEGDDDTQPNSPKYQEYPLQQDDVEPPKNGWGNVKPSSDARRDSDYMTTVTEAPTVSNRPSNGWSFARPTSQM